MRVEEPTPNPRYRAAHPIPEWTAENPAPQKLVDEPDVRPLLRESCGVGERSRRPGACRVTGGGGGIDHCRMGG